MKFVYLLRSIKFPDQTYIGLTSDVQKRLAAHNAGQSSHTSKYAPWNLVAFMGFEDERKAADFEIYLKSGSGRAFAAKRFW
jgi:predicted GIY-YIG superfamily endonuclease